MILKYKKPDYFSGIMVIISNDNNVSKFYLTTYLNCVNHLKNCLNLVV